MALLDRGALAESENRLRMLVQQHPEDAGIHRALALLASRSGQAQMALQHMVTATRLAPQSGHLHSDLGRMLASAGRLPEALQSFQHAVALEPELVDGWYFLGVTLRRLDRDHEALPALRRARALAPAHLEIFTALAEAEFDAGDPATALALWQELTALLPETPNSYLKQAECLSRLGAHDAAIAVYRSATERLPASAELWMGMAQAAEDSGDRDGAEHAYRQALALRPGWPFPIAGLLELKRGNASPELVAQASALQRSSELTDPARALLGYGLGKVHDGQHRPVEAFASWRDANAARRREIGPLDRDALRRRVEQTIAAFAAGSWDRLAGAGSDDSRPLFVVGMPRSGTTLAEQIIAAHPDACGCGELPDISLIAHGLPSALGSALPWPQALAVLDAATVRQQAQRYLRTLDTHGGSSMLRAVDKAPLNFFHVGLIALLFPHARVVWCRRDPRDISLSIYSENFSLHAQYATDLADIAHYIRAHETLMRHWQTTAPLPILELHYEQLVTDLETQTRRLIDFVGLPWDGACLDFHRSGRAVQTPSRWQVRQPVYTRSVGRWQRYTQWLGPLQDALAADD